MRKIVFCCVVLLMLALALPAVAQSAAGDAQAAITKMENDAVKADLSGDASFYQRALSDDWTAGTSLGKWDDKQSMLNDMKDPKNNKVNSESISDLKVRVDGDVAVATYKTTYDAMIHGQHVARTIISTDVFRMENGAWKQISSHSSQAQ